jgi:hypothetical protein
MAKKCSLDPQRINEHVWYYESPTRIEVYHEIYDGEKFIRTQRILIPRRKLEASLRRMNDSRRKRA